MNNQDRIEAIEAFRATPKFRCTEPEFAYLKPSPDSVFLQARRTLEKCIEQVIGALQTEKRPEDIRSLIAKAVLEVEKGDLDTEDREYVAFYFHKLGTLAGINVAFTVNRWLYGWPLALLALLKRRGEQKAAPDRR